MGIQNDAVDKVEIKRSVTIRFNDPHWQIKK
jgi:hypothetical protein